MRTTNKPIRTMILRELFYFCALILFLGSTSLLVAVTAPIPLSHADVKSTTLTPQDQYDGTAADIETTRKIRENLTKDNSLSSNAKNVKIITLKGVTTLRGAVDSLEESLYVQRIANNVNENHIKNNLKVSNH